MLNSRLIAAAIVLATAAPVAAACVLLGVATTYRKTGTATVTVSGSKTITGRYPAVCGAYFVADAPPLGKAGDGMVFQTCIPDLGSFQVNGSGKERKAGPMPDAGLILNTDQGSFAASGDAATRVTVGADFFSANVKASLQPIRRPKPGEKVQTFTIEAKFACGK